MTIFVIRRAKIRVCQNKEKHEIQKDFKYFENENIPQVSAVS